MWRLVWHTRLAAGMRICSMPFELEAWHGRGACAVMHCRTPCRVYDQECNKVMCAHCCRQRDIGFGFRARFQILFFGKAEDLLLVGLPAGAAGEHPLLMAALYGEVLD